uniref:Thiamine transporter 2 n=1 Tax=Panagrolaimus sp. PS1159 TaxID=55785 RepID=A0AC35G2U8_9BILA
METVLTNETRRIAETINALEKKEGYFQKIKTDFPIILKNERVITWSLWWILTSGLISQLYNYDQILWSTMQCDDHDIYNGIVAGIDTAGSAVIVFSLQYIHFDWEKHGEIISFLSTLYFGCLYFVMAIVENLFIQYLLYLMSVFCYVALITVAMTIITSQLDPGTFGLVFGFNTVTATLLQSMITFAVVDSRGFNLTVRGHFAVYSSCFMILSLIFLLVLIRKCNAKVKFE